MTTTFLTLEDRARSFAETAHTGQFRKYTGEPYIAHPAAVVELVRSVPHGEAMIAAAWLHDVVEDCGVSSDTIYTLFGIEVGQLVDWLTDVSKPEDGNRHMRKTIDRNHTANASAAAKTIKLADLIHNTTSIVEHDPDFALVYLKEKELLLDVLKEGDPELWQTAYKRLQEGQLHLVHLALA